MLTPRFLGWTAGFLEGEGNFYFARNKRAGYIVRVSACQKQREPLDRLRLAFGGGIFLRANREIHDWVLDGPRAVGLMMTLYSMMSPKRRVQIRAVLDQWRCRPGKGGNQRVKTACPRGHPYDHVERYADGRPRVRRCTICRNEFERSRRRLSVVKSTDA